MFSNWYMKNKHNLSLTKRNWIGFISVTIFWWLYLIGSTGNATYNKINGYVDNELTGFIEDSYLQEATSRDYGFSLRNVTLSDNNIDFIITNDKKKLLYIAPEPTQIIDSLFVSPLVFHMWDDVVKALSDLDIIWSESGITNSYSLDFQKLLNLILLDYSWSDIGVTGVHGKVSIITLNMLDTETGRLLIGLIANTLNYNRTVTYSDIPNIIDNLKKIVEKSNDNETNPSQLLESFVRDGISGKPLIALLENNMIAYANTYPSGWYDIAPLIKTVYPTYIVWGKYDMLSYTESGDILANELKQNYSMLRDTAWYSYGFRKNMQPTDYISYSAEEIGIRNEVRGTMQMPSDDIIDEIIRQLK